MLVGIEAIFVEPLTVAQHQQCQIFSFPAPLHSTVPAHSVIHPSVPRFSLVWRTTVWSEVIAKEMLGFSSTADIYRKETIVSATTLLVFVRHQE